MSSKNFNMNFDPQTRQQFAKVLEGYGLTVPQAFKLLANQVIHTGVLPLSFDWQAKAVPNATTKAAIVELENGKGTSYSSPEDAMQAMIEIANSQ